MSDKFQVGDKVRVLRGFDYELFPQLRLVEGQVYTVTSITDEGNGHGTSDYGINVDNGDGGHGSWDADRFELVTEVGEPGQPEPTKVIPTGIQQAHAKAEALFAYLAQGLLLAIAEQKPGHLAFLRELLQQVDDVMFEIEEAYPALNKAVN